MADTPELASDTGEAETDFQATEKASEFRYKTGISGKQTLRWEKVNEATFKITGGDLITVPSCHGYRTTKAQAWAIQIGPAQWLARCRDQACGPSFLTMRSRTPWRWPRVRSVTTRSEIRFGT